MSARKPIAAQQGDFIAVLCKVSDGTPHWILGQVNSNPYEGDLDLHVWEKHRSNPLTDISSNPEYGELLERISDAKEKLHASMDDAAELSAQMRLKRVAILNDIRDAEEFVAESKAIMDAAREDIEKIPDKHWRELKSYRVAPKMVLVVLRAVMLLLCEDDARSWAEMQKILRDPHFKSRVTTYNAEMRLSPERREFIMRECVSRSSFQYDRATQGSLAMGPIYYWVLAQLDSGEAFLQKHHVDKEKLARQRELRDLLRQVNEEAEKIVDHDALMDSLDEELRRWYRSVSNGPSRKIEDGLATQRYMNSFAGSSSKAYLRPAYYMWTPTNRVITTLRSSVICNFGPITREEAHAGMNGLTDDRIHTLDNAICRRLNYQHNDGDTARNEREMERNMLKQAVPDKWESLTKCLEGDDWESVVEKRRQDVIDVFMEESSLALNVNPTQVQVSNVMVDSVPTVVSFEVCHSGRRGPLEMQELVNDYEYPKLQQLYETEILTRKSARASFQGPLNETETNIEDLPPVTFCGTEWGECLHAHREELSDAFVSEVQGTLPPTGNEKVVVTAMKATPDNLVVHFEIHDSHRTTAEVTGEIEVLTFNNVWELYQEHCDARKQNDGAYESSFEGPDWGRVVSERKEDLEEAFTRDESACLGIGKNQIIIRSLTCDSEALTVRYDADPTVNLSSAMKNRKEHYPYENMWALYEDAESVVTTHQIGFEGSDWTKVLANHFPQLEQRFIRCTVDALELADQDLISLQFSSGSLLAHFQLRHPSRLTEYSINETLSNCPYLPVWELLEMVEKEEQTQPKETTHEVAFESEGWEKLVREQEGLIRTAVVQDVCDALESKPQDIQLSSVRFNNGSLEVVVVVLHLLQESEVQDRLEGFNFPLTWDLLARSSSAGRFTGVMERRFTGDVWAEIIEDSPEAVREAFCRDAALTLGVNPEDIEVTEMRVGSLIVSYRVRDPTVADDEVAQKLREDDQFPTIQSLYQSRSQSRARRSSVVNFVECTPRDVVTVSGQRVFNGEEWPSLLKTHETAINRAVIQDVADARSTPEFSVRVDHITADGNGLKIGFTVPVASPGESQEDFENESAVYTFPRVMALYRSIAPHLHTDDYVVHFSAEGWAYIVRRRRWELSRAISDDAGEACDILPDEVVDVSFHVAPDAMTATMRICHPKTFSKEDIEQKLFLCAFRRVWEMYELYAPRGPIIRDFLGEGWMAIYREQEEELRRAFLTDTTTALSLTRLEVDVTSIEAPADGCHINFSVQGCPLTAEQAQSSCDSYLYPEMWALYEKTMQSMRVQSFNNRRVFQGDRWRTVVSTRRQAVSQAFQNDTAAALDVPPETIFVPQIEANDECMTIHYYVKMDGKYHITEAELVKRLESCPYTMLWDEYFRSETLSQSEADESPSGDLHRRFEGDRWGSVLRDRRDEANRAFVKGVSDSLNVPPENVEVLNMREGSLLVDYRVHHPPHSDDEINDRVARHGFPELHALHPRAMEPRSMVPVPFAPIPSVRDYEVGFDGSEWASILRNHHDELHQAFRDDTAECLNCSSYMIEGLTFQILQQLVAYFGIQVTSVDRSPEAVDRELRVFPYPRMWALYNRVTQGGRSLTPGVVVTNHAIHFDGEAWNVVCQLIPERLVSAVSEDVCLCLGIPANDILQVMHSVTPHESLNSVVRIQHAPSLTTEKIKDLLAVYSYPTVWSLYDVARESRIFEKTFDGDRWEDLLRRNRKGISLAFRSDCSEMLSLPTSYVRIHKVHATKKGLHVAYSLLGNWFSDGQIEARCSAGAFPQVWSFYSNPEDNLHCCRISFPGEQWETFLKSYEFRKKLDQAFVRDVGRCGIPPEHAHLKSMVANEEEGLRIEFDCSSPQNAYVDARGAMKCYDFPAIWGVFREALDNAPAQSSKAVVPIHSDCTTRHAVTFEGTGWRGVWKTHRSQVIRIFQREVATALDVPQDNVSRTARGPSKTGAFVLVTDVKHSDAYPLHEIDRRLVAYPFTEFWSLYEEEQPAHNRGGTVVNFEGRDWGYVYAQKEREVRNALVAEAAEALQVPSSQVRDLSCTSDLNGLHARLMVDGVTQLELKHLNTCPFRRVWDLYCLPNQDYKGSKVFQGVWTNVVKRFRSEIEGAFQDDTCDALEVYRDSVDRPSISCDHSGNLVVNYVVHASHLTEENVFSVIRGYSYSRVWSLYTQRPAASGDLHRRFEGDRWGSVLRDRRGEANRAFVKGVSDSLNVPPENVEVLDMREGSLLVDYRVHHPAHEDDEINDRVARHGFPELHALHPRAMEPRSEPRSMEPRSEPRVMHPAPVPVPIPVQYVTSNLSRDFVGEGWRDVPRESLEAAFLVDTASALGVPKQDLRVTSLQGCVTVHFTVEHLSSWRKESLQDMVDEYSYERVWALYKESPSRRTYQTTHPISLPGDNWAAVDDRKHAQIEEALRRDVAMACGLPMNTVQIAHLSPTSDRLAATCEVTHNPNTLSEAELHSRLNACPFTEARQLYEPRTHAPVMEADPISLFPGDRWEEVVQAHRSAIRSAFIKDTADVLNCSPRVIEVTSLFTSDSGLAINYVVLNGQPSNTNANRLTNATYPNVWALYEVYRRPPPTRQASSSFSLPVPLAANPDTYTPWRVHRFQGSDWEYVLSRQRPALENAFREDVAEDLGIPPNRVEIRGVSLGSLLVDYRVRNAGMSTERVHRQVEHGRFSRVWAMYRPSPVTPVPYAAAVPRHNSVSHTQLTSRSNGSRSNGSILLPPATQEYNPATARRSVYQQPQISEAERRAQREVQEADSRAERARREREEAAQVAEARRRDAQRAEAEADRALREAEERRERARRSAREAEASAAERARRAEDEERRAREAREAASRVAAPRPLDGTEEEVEVDQLTYLRRELQKSREENSRYRRQLGSQTSPSNASFAR